jgi:hypothetical protein
MISGVPVFPEFREILLTDKELFEHHVSKNQKSSSEYTFTNFYIWRECDRSQLTMINNNLCIEASPDGEQPYFFEPLGENKIEETIKICLSRTPRFSRISEEFAQAHFIGKAGLKIEQDPNNSDYIYRTADLIELKGKKYDGKRNKIKKFLKNNSPVYHAMTEAHIPDSLKLLDKWTKPRKSGVCFDEPAKEMMNNFSELKPRGGIIRIKGNIEAFTVGEKINNDTAVIYIEIANPDIDGLAQYINQMFCKHEWGGIQFINREQDLGDPGLRKAKLSYHPIKMINKYSVTLID